MNQSNYFTTDLNAHDATVAPLEKTTHGTFAPGVGLLCLMIWMLGMGWAPVFGVIGGMCSLVKSVGTYLIRCSIEKCISSLQSTVFHKTRVAFHRTFCIIFLSVWNWTKNMWHSGRLSKEIRGEEIPIEYSQM